MYSDTKQKKIIINEISEINLSATAFSLLTSHLVQYSRYYYDFSKNFYIRYFYYSVNFQSWEALQDFHISINVFQINHLLHWNAFEG